MNASQLGPYHPAVHAAARPNHPAQVWERDGSVTTYAQLATRSAQGARVLRALGLRPGDHVALVLDNHPAFLEICWAALRAGLYCTPVSTWLTPSEATAVLEDTGASLVIATADQAPLAQPYVNAGSGPRGLAVGGAIDGFGSWDAEQAGQLEHPLDAEPEGAMMLYSSGTTSRPKGVRRPLSGAPCGTTNPLAPFLTPAGLGPDTVYLSPGPLYHAAALGWCLGTQRVGGTAVVMERFEPAAVLEAVERHRVTHLQLVPTMMARIVHLPESLRRAADLSSLRHVIHAGAPCPPAVKEEMISWVGPIVDEYYSGTEGSGITFITSEDWLEHRGSVGRPILGQIHVTDEAGSELAAGEEGIVWFSSGGSFEYHRDPEATARRTDARRGWTTLDDVGYLDRDGYLYLTDRRAHMIVTGGVNVSPREVEDLLASHPAVADAAVIGVPDDDFGERVLAVVQPTVGRPAGEAEAAELIAELDAHCRAHLARYKCPRDFELVDELPRLPTGKLAKRLLRDARWAGRSTRIV